MSGPPRGGHEERLAPAPGVRRLMMTAAARALEDGRTEISVPDVLLALSHDQDTGPLLAEIGASESAIRSAIRPGG